MDSTKQQVMDAAPRGLNAYHAARLAREARPTGKRFHGAQHVWVRDDRPGWRGWLCLSCAVYWAIPAKQEAPATAR